MSYRPSGRDATITTAQRVLAKLLQSSQLSDAHVPVETICQSPEDCRNVYGLPRQQGLERWQEGFVVDELVTLQSRLSASEAIVTTDDLRIRKAEDGLLVSRPGVFSLRLFESGDTFRIVNELNGYHKYDNGEGYYDEMEAEALGRELIEELKLVSLAETEELVLLKTNYVRFTGNDASPGDRVVSTQVTFGRTIGGTPILGKSGSTISIEFIANRDVHRISVDWSPVDVSETESVQFASVEQISRRIDQGVGTEPKLICGYLDDGGRTRGVLRLGLGCLAQVDSERRFIGVEAGESELDQLPVEKQLLAARPVLAAQGGPEQQTMSCSLGAVPSRDLPWRAIFWTSVAGVLALNRRRGLRSRTSIALLALIAVNGGSRHSAEAATYTTLMNREFQDPDLATFGSQWTNYNDWTDEMNDIASCATCASGDMTVTLYEGSTYNDITYQSDLIAVATHGSNNGSENSLYAGYLYGYTLNDEANSRLMGPNAAQSGKTDIMLIFGCSFFPEYNDLQWYGFRNMFRRGLDVAASCWGPANEGSCSMTQSSTNSTWNEIGDSIADSEQTIWNSWRDGFDVGPSDDWLIIYGLGKKSNADCDDKASGMKFQSRDSYTAYTYGKDLSLTGSYEVCGYYVW